MNFCQLYKFTFLELRMVQCLYIKVLFKYKSTMLLFKNINSIYCYAKAKPYLSELTHLEFIQYDQILEGLPVKGVCLKKSVMCS